MREVSDKNVLNDFCTRFCDIVEKHAKYIIVSGFVAIASGRTRGTEDIDMILERLDKPRFDALHRDLSGNGFVCMQSGDVEVIYKDYLDHRLGVRYTDKDSFLPEMEVKFAKDVLDELQIKERVRLPLTGLNVWFGSVEMNIAFKEMQLKSDKDMEDARHLRLAYDPDEIRISICKKMIGDFR